MFPSNVLPVWLAEGNNNNDITMSITDNNHVRLTATITITAMIPVSMALTMIKQHK